MDPQTLRRLVWDFALLLVRVEFAFHPLELSPSASI